MGAFQGEGPVVMVANADELVAQMDSQGLIAMILDAIKDRLHKALYEGAPIYAGTVFFHVYQKDFGSYYRLHTVTLGDLAEIPDRHKPGWLSAEMAKWLEYNGYLAVQERGDHHGLGLAPDGPCLYGHSGVDRGTEMDHSVYVEKASRILVAFVHIKPRNAEEPVFKARLEEPDLATLRARYVTLEQEIRGVFADYNSATNGEGVIDASKIMADINLMMSHYEEMIPKAIEDYLPPIPTYI